MTEALYMHSMSYTPPYPLSVVSWVSIAIASLASLWLTFDIVHRRGWRTMMAIMIPVYVINALYLWPITVWTYLEYGRPDMPAKEENVEDGTVASEHDPLLHQHTTDTDHRAGTQGTASGNSHAGHNMDHSGGAHRHHHEMSVDRPIFATITIATCHCGAGCVLGDIVGEWFVYRTGVTVGGSMLYAAFIIDFVLALLFGIVFQYFSIAPMARDYGWKTIARSIKADFLSLTFFEIGLFGWMAIFDLLIFDQKLGMNTATYWFMMQVSDLPESNPYL